VILLFAVILCSVYGDKVKYDGYSVLRMHLNSTNYFDIKTIADQYNLDIWATNGVEKWMDIMIPPNQEILNIIKQHDHIVSIADVEEHIQSIDGHVNKKRQAFFDNYRQWAEISAWLDEQKAIYPSNCDIIVIGQTSQGREMKGLKIYNNNGGSKRAVFLQGGIHAREWITVTSALFIIQELLRTSPKVLDNFDFYILPVLNVDGYSFSHSNERLWRKNRQPNTGSTCIGTDLNRNYAYEWGKGGTSSNPCSDIFLGRTPASTPEVAAVTSYLSKLPGLVFFVDIHSYGAMFMCPWGYTYELPPDYNQMLSIMQVAQTRIRSINNNHYAIGTSANVIYIAAGMLSSYYSISL